MIGLSRDVTSVCVQLAVRGAGVGGGGLSERGSIWLRFEKRECGMEWRNWFSE